MQVRLAGVDNMRAYLQHYIEFNVDSSWLNYLERMSTPGVWCDHIIIQDVANAYNCIIDITETNTGFNETTSVGLLVNNSLQQQSQRTIYIGHLSEIHYVSTKPIIENTQNSVPVNSNMFKMQKVNGQEKEKQKKIMKSI